MTLLVAEMPFNNFYFGQPLSSEMGVLFRVDGRCSCHVPRGIQLPKRIYQQRIDIRAKRPAPIWVFHGFPGHLLCASASGYIRACFFFFFFHRRRTMRLVMLAWRDLGVMSSPRITFFPAASRLSLIRPTSQMMRQTSHGSICRRQLQVQDNLRQSSRDHQRLERARVCLRRTRLLRRHPPPPPFPPCSRCYCHSVACRQGCLVTSSYSAGLRCSLFMEAVAEVARK